MTDTSRGPALHVDRITKEYRVGALGQRSIKKALDAVSLDVPHNSVMGLVGESGSGKSTLGRIAVGLIPPTSGTIDCVGENLATLRGEPLRRHRKKMQMIFQDSGSALNPRMSLTELLIEPLRVQGIGNVQHRLQAAHRIADEVGLAQSWLSRYPHEFSGGQRQRIAIARGLILEPDFVVADEPVSALDVSIQAQILNLLKDIQQHRNLAMLFISHDLSVVEFISDQITVLYHGRVVEQGDADTVVNSPTDDYTRTLIEASRL